MSNSYISFFTCCCTLLNLLSFCQSSKDSEYIESRNSGLLIDTERTIALLQGLRACCLFRSLPVTPEEEICKKWLSLEIFASGFESQPLLTETPVKFVTGDPGLCFIRGLVYPHLKNETAEHFLLMVHNYCKRKNMTLLLTEHNPDHPVEKFSRLFLTCLLKLHDLVQLALVLVDQRDTTNDCSVHFPSAIADICKVVYDAKLTLVKSRQESSCTYEEICGPVIDRCLFLIDNIRSPATNVHSILHRHQAANIESRWKSIAKKALKWYRHKNQDQSTLFSDDTAVREETGSLKRLYYQRQQSREKKVIDQADEVMVFVL